MGSFPTYVLCQSQCVSVKSATQPMHSPPKTLPKREDGLRKMRI